MCEVCHELNCNPANSHVGALTPSDLRAVVLEQLVLTRVWLCDPTDCSPPGSSAHGILQARMKAESGSLLVTSYSLRPYGLYSSWCSPGQNTGVGSLSLLQRIFPTQGPNPGLPRSRWILYQLSHKESPILDCHSLVQRISLT